MESDRVLGFQFELEKRRQKDNLSSSDDGWETYEEEVCEQGNVHL